MAHRLLKSISCVASFAAIGAIIGYLNYYSQIHGTDFWENLVASIAPQCLAAVAALPSWSFRVGETYWKAPLLCAVTLASWLILHHYLTDLLPTDRSGRITIFWEAVDLWIYGSVEVFSILAYVVRALIVRTNTLAGIISVLLLGAVNLIFLSAGPFSTETLWIGFVAQYSFLLGIAALAAQVLPRKTVAPLIRTSILEAR